MIESRTYKGELIYSDRSIVKYDISFPEVTDVMYSYRVNIINEKNISELLREIRQILYPQAVAQYRLLSPSDTFVPFEINSSYEIMCDRDGILSYFVDIFCSKGAQGTSMRRISRTWDLGCGMLVTTNRLFKRNVNWLNAVINNAAPLIKDFENEMGTRCFGQWQSIVAEAVRMNRYYIADDGIAIYVGQGKLASDIWGIPTFLLKYKNINSILSKRFMQH